MGRKLKLNKPLLLISTAIVLLLAPIALCYPDIIQITDNSYADSYPKINDKGYVVWRGYAHSESPTADIFLYDGTSITRITNNSYADRNPQINDNGYVVWDQSYAPPFFETEVLLYDGTATIQLSTSGDRLYDEKPQINNE